MRCPRVSSSWPASAPSESVPRSRWSSVPQYGQSSTSQDHREPQRTPPLGADELREPRPRAADEAVAALPAIEIGKRMRLRRGLPEDRLERELDELAERGRVDAERGRRERQRGSIVLQRGHCERGDIDICDGELRRCRVSGRPDERGLGEVLRDTRELAREVAVVEGEASCGKERLTLRDGALGLGGRQR